MTAEDLTQTMATLSVQDSEQLEDLIASARYGELEEIQDLVKTSGLDKVRSLLSHRGEYGKTPLHMAAANNHVDIVEYLITIIPSEAINIQNDEGNTALHWAATNGHEEIVKLLITKGNANYKLKNSAGHTALTEAELHERSQVVTWMLNNTEELKDGDNDDDSDSSSSEEEDDEKAVEAAQGSSSRA
ncbi:hypothetical protein BGX31_002607 [Mortierella sp. GBA43]|nr:hypothetical protein BGX31_002607 [Mortierella sp. GBA43]